MSIVKHAYYHLLNLAKNFEPAEHCHKRNQCEGFSDPTTGLTLSKTFHALFNLPSRAL